MSYINPDYPTNVGSFAQHTYQGQQSFNNGNTFYYGGAGYGTMMAPDNGARRPDGNVVPPQQPYGAFNQPTGYYGQIPTPAPQSQIPTGVGQMLSTPEQGVQPFATYPPNNNTPYGFNQFTTDARRADANAAQAVGNNPWATQQPVQNPAPMMTPPPNMYQPQQTFNYNPGYGDASAMYQYGGFGQNPFEKKPGTNMWDNMYVQQQPYVQPAPNQMQWNSPQNTQPQQNVYSFPQAGSCYPSTNPPAFQQTGSWDEFSKKTWDNK
jgi:hypothetical protein